MSQTHLVPLLLLLLATTTTALHGQVPAAPFEPRVGQPGKDVVWVPTPPELVEKMLDMAQVTAVDVVIDLGSGDGRNVIAAARRGARALGVEFNSEMVALSRRLATEAGVSDKARFVEGDMFEADISQASVMAIYLLPANMMRLQPKFLALKPGTRIVANTFGFEEWDPDARATVDGLSCSGWCEALLWIVPAQVGGVWQLGEATLSLQQSAQILFGTLTHGGVVATLGSARMQGEEIRFVAGGVEYRGRVTGNAMSGTTTGATPIAWTATRTP